MFANYNFSLFPIVIVDFDNSEINNYQFDLFLNNWESIYNLNKSFTLIFGQTFRYKVAPQLC